VLVETALKGREIECAVLGGRGGGPARTAGPGEIVVDSSHRFYDFEAKYLADEITDLLVPAPLDPSVAAEVRRLAQGACRALDIEGLARVDTFVTADGVFINEVNSMPGFTPRSLFPRVWAASGTAYPDLVAGLVEEALARPQGLR
jgi:D-alanine-D-alanine ligase